MSMSRIALPELSFYDWIKGFPCYDRNIDMFVRNVEFQHFYSAFASVSQVCSRCFGCGTPLECVLDTPW